MEKDIKTVEDTIEDEVETKEAQEEASFDAAKTTVEEDTPVEENKEASNEDVKEDSNDDNSSSDDIKEENASPEVELVEDNEIKEKEKKKKEHKTTKEKVFFGFKIAGNVLFYLIIIFLFLISIMNINASNNDGMPSLFGRSYLSVQSDSMKKPYSYSNPYLQTTNTKARKGVNYYKFELITLPEGTDTPEDTYTHDYGQFFEYLGTKLGDKTYYKKVKVDIKSGSKIDERLYTTYEDEYSSYEIKNFKKGDMLVDKTLSNSEKKNLKVGDVITFWDTTLGSGTGAGLNSHRIVFIDEENNYYLMGDFSLRMYSSYGRYSRAEGQEEDEWLMSQGKTIDNNVDVITPDDYKLIKGKVVDIWSGFGKTYDNIMNNMALYFMVFVFPVILLFLISMIFVILNIRKLVISKKKASAEPIMTEDEMKQSLEAERERMRQEILAELKKEQEMNQKSEEDKEEK